MRVVINGLGRIGRCVLRAYFLSNNYDFDIVAVNGPAAVEDHMHLLRYDSIHGIFSKNLEIVDDNNFTIDGKNIKLFRERDISKLSWQDIDIVLECSGQFNNKLAAEGHITVGAKKVIVSAPCKNADATIVYGVNNEIYDHSKHNVISAGSCTTNCLAPVAHTIHQNFGIERGFMTTIHAYTNDQQILDKTHKDKRRARAAAMSMIPTSTGAAKSIGEIIPELAGKIDGTAVRIPIPNVSMIDLCFDSAKPISIESLNKTFTDAANTNLKNVMAISNEPLVSIDYVGNKNSAIVDMLETKVIDGKFGRVCAWYDNEWAFSLRMLDIAQMISNIAK